MRTHTIAACFLVAVAALGVAVTGEPPADKAERRLKLLLTPDDNGQMVVRPADDKKPAGDSALLTCDSFRFTPQGVVFASAVLETKDQRITADEITVAPAEQTRWQFSDDFKIQLKSADAKRGLLNIQE